MALLQTTVKPEMQGRVLTAPTVMYSLASPLGLAIAGPVADLVGPQMWFVLAGVTCLIVGLVVVRTRALDHGRDASRPRPGGGAACGGRVT
jgi:predicted MFS family arabinose efflux permease